MWPFKKDKPKTVIPVVSDPRDIALLNCMTNCTVSGKIVLPSGMTIPAPPSGKVWHVNKTEITLRDQ